MLRLPRPNAATLLTKPQLGRLIVRSALGRFNEETVFRRRCGRSTHPPVGLALLGQRRAVGRSRAHRKIRWSGSQLCAQNTPRHRAVVSSRPVHNEPLLCRSFWQYSPRGQASNSRRPQRLCTLFAKSVEGAPTADSVVSPFSHTHMVFGGAPQHGRRTTKPCSAHCIASQDVLTMTAWMAPTRSRTVDCLPRQRFPSQEVIHRSRRLRARLRGWFQRAGSVRGQRVVWRGVHRMWCADRRRIRLPHLNASCRPFAELDAWPNEAGARLLVVERRWLAHDGVDRQVGVDVDGRWHRWHRNQHRT
jgi:hypothetical protein